MSTVPLAVRVKNARYDGNLTGYLIGAPKFQKADPGGFKAASFTVSQKLGFRSDMIQPYSRIYIYNQRNGDCVFEGDVSHPGRSVTDDGAILEVQVDGGAERLNDWSGSRIYVDRDMQAWVKNPAQALPATTVEVGDDRSGSGLDALTLAFPDETHVESLYRAEAFYTRIRESSQTIGYFDYTVAGGHNSGSPGWQVRLIISPPSTVARTNTLATSILSSPQNVTGNNWDTAYMQLIWTSGSSNTGTLNNVWASIRGLVLVVRMKLKDGTNRTSGLAGAVTASQVWEDMLGSEMLNTAFDGANARVDAGTATWIWQMAYPDGVTPAQIAEDLMTYEQGMTYIVGPSNPANGKYTFSWYTRSDSVRYEALLWADEHSGGTQAVDQYNEVVARWKTPVGNLRMTTSTQSIPEMDAVGRKRRFFQDLGTVLGDADNVTTANSTVLQDHRYPRNTGRVRISRPIVDLWTGRTVQPFEIEPACLIRLVGINPSPDALNTSLTPNGSTICRIVNTDYDGESNSVDLDLDEVPYSMAQAIRVARARRKKGLPQRRAD